MIFRIFRVPSATKIKLKSHIRRHQKISDESSRIQNALLRACNAMPSHIRKPHVENLTDCLCTMSAVLSRVSWFATKIQFPDGWMVKFRGCSPEPSINSKGTFWHIWRIPSGCNPLGLRFRHQSLHLYHSISIPTAKSQPSAILSHPQQLLLCK